MPHVSAQKLNKDLSNKLFQKLLKTLEKAHKKDLSGSLLRELFTQTEKIMFAKRLGIILLLSQNVPQHKIAETLKVSPSSVARFSLGLECGRYNSILNASKDTKVDLGEIIWKILTMNGYLPPKVGKRYWTKYRK